MIKKSILSICLLLLFDIILIYFLVFGISYFNLNTKVSGVLVLTVFLILKICLYILFFKKLNLDGLDQIRNLILNFKKGRFTIFENNYQENSIYYTIYNDLSLLGRYLDDLIITQKKEIEEFRDLYNNILFSVSSYVVALNEKREVVFVNKSFCNNFQYNVDEIAGEKFDNLFFFTAGRLSNTINDVKKHGGSNILQHVRLLSKNGIAIITDIKISRMIVHGKNQIILVMDDITSKCRKDYQISLISQISESIQTDKEIERVLYSILTGVTSGTGLGFNRAMLFLYDEKKSFLVGKMGVGPDNVDEAVQIWASVQDEDANILKQLDGPTLPMRNGKDFYNKVINSSFPLSSNNILVKTLITQQSVHIHDAWNDSRIDPEICEFLDVIEFVIVPLVAGKKSIGIVIADNKYNQSPIWQDNVELLTIFAAQAALSIESCNNLFSLRDQMEKMKARQDAIVQTEKLAAVGRIAAHIAHEIRNPLITVGGYARRVLQFMENASKNEEKIIKSIEIVLKEAERLEKILSNVMDFTRPLPYIREFHDFNEIIYDTIDLLKNVFQEKKIEYKLELSENLPSVKSDFNQLKQVMLNLLQNAMDATPEGGIITLQTEVKGDKVIIRVKDTGIGIKEEDLEHLFDPFFTTKITGVGLGLAIVKKIINDHGGKIKVRNRKSKGTEFSIELAHSA